MRTTSSFHETSMQWSLHRRPLRLFLLGVIVSISGVQAGARAYDPVLERRNIIHHPTAAMSINGPQPGPLLRFEEGANVIINVQAERRLVGANVAGRMEPALPRLCALGQAICVPVAPETTYKANWQVYQRGRPVEVLCVENPTKEAAYVVSRPQPERPPEVELEDGLKFCSPLMS